MTAPRTLPTHATKPQAPYQPFNALTYGAHTAAEPTHTPLTTLSKTLTQTRPTPSDTPQGAPH